MWCTFDLVVFKVILRSFGALVSKWPVSRKGLVVERNGPKFGNHEHWLYIYKVIWPCRVQGHFRVIQCTCLKISCISKRAGRRAKWTEIYESRTLVIHIQGNLTLWGSRSIWITYIWGTYDLVVFKVILGSFSALVSKWAVSRKGLVIERNGVKFGIRNTSYTYVG